MKHVGTALAGAVAVAFTQLAIAQSSGGSYDQQPNPAYGAQQGADRRPDTVRGEDDPPRNDWRYPGKPEGDD